MGRKNYKLENTLGRLIKELRDNNYEVEQISDLDGHGSGLFYINTREEPNPDDDGYMIGEINLGNDGTRLTLTMYDSSKSRKKVLNIAKKYLEKPHKTKTRSAKNKLLEYKHHQWVNDGYRAARKNEPKYTCDIEKHKTAPQ